MEAIKASLRSFILMHCVPGESAENLPDDLPLRKTGVLDSIALLKLVRFIETEFQIEVEPHDIDGNFDSIAKLAAFVQQRRG